MDQIETLPGCSGRPPHGYAGGAVSLLVGVVRVDSSYSESLPYSPSPMCLKWEATQNGRRTPNGFGWCSREGTLKSAPKAPAADGREGCHRDYWDGSSGKENDVRLRPRRCLHMPASRTKRVLMPASRARCLSPPQHAHSQDTSEEREATLRLSRFRMGDTVGLALDLERATGPRGSTPLVVTSKESDSLRHPLYD